MSHPPRLRPLIERAGWPQQKPCLGCGRLRRAQHPGDRLHDKCQQPAVYLERGVLRFGQ